MKKLDYSFYRRPTVTVSKDLLGKLIVKNGMQVRIVETEAYIGPIDKGCHAYNYNRTKRNEAMFGPPGHAYVYLIYGMYFCLNLVTEEEGEPCAVLIRAVEPVKGLNEMAINRYSLTYEQLDSYKARNISNGPGKLCKALNITKEQNGTDITKDAMFVAEDSYSGFKTIETKRINIDYAEEAKDFPWRFYIKDNPYVSKK